SNPFQPFQPFQPFNPFQPFQPFKPPTLPPLKSEHIQIQPLPRRHMESLDRGILTSATATCTKGQLVMTGQQIQEVPRAILVECVYPLRCAVVQNFKNTAEADRQRVDVDGTR